MLVFSSQQVTYHRKFKWTVLAFYDFPKNEIRKSWDIMLHGKCTRLPFFFISFLIFKITNVMGGCLGSFKEHSFINISNINKLVSIALCKFASKAFLHSDILERLGTGQQKIFPTFSIVFCMQKSSQYICNYKITNFLEVAAFLGVVENWICRMSTVR